MPRSNSSINAPGLPELFHKFVLTDTVDILRNTQTGTDPGGQPLPEEWTVVYEAVPCRWFPRFLQGGIGAITWGPQQNFIEDYGRFVFYPDQDITDLDRFDNIIDKDGNRLNEGMMYVNRPVQKHRSYIEVGIKVITGA